MKLAKKMLAVVLCMAMLASASMMSLAVSAEDMKESVEGVRWFPANMERNNGFDDMWEVDCGDGVAQRFNEAETNPDAAEPHLSTTYDENGALTLKRTGADGNDFYWPRIRTLYLENVPSIDLKTANTLYYDFEATEKWMILMTFGDGLQLKLGKAICEQAGTATLANSDEDGAPGVYKGSINLNDAIAAIAADSADPHSMEMSALQSMKKLYIPQLVVFVVGSKEASVKMNSLFISTADDTAGDKCDFMDLGLVYGEEVYEEAPEEDPDDTDAPADETTTTKANTATTTKAADKADGDKTDNAGFNATPWIIAAVVVVVIGAAVAVVIVLKKKKGAE